MKNIPLGKLNLRWMQAALAGILCLLLVLPLTNGAQAEGGAASCSPAVDMVGGFLASGTVTVKLKSQHAGAASLSHVSGNNSTWTALLLTASPIAVDQEVQVKFTAPKQPSAGGDYKVVRLDIGSGCYLVQAASSAPFLLGYQYREAEKTLDYIFLRPNNASTSFSSSYIADRPDAPAYYDMDRNSLAIVPTNSRGRYHVVYVVIDSQGYQKIEYYPYTLGSTPPRPTDLTFRTDAQKNAYPSIVYDILPTVAVAPNGAAAVAFTRKPLGGIAKVGLVFIDAQGAVVYPSGCDNGCLIDQSDGSYQVAIAATADNRFLVAWERKQAGHTNYDIGLAVYSAASLAQIGSTQYIAVSNDATSVGYNNPVFASYDRGSSAFLTYLASDLTSQSLVGRTIQSSATVGTQQTVAAPMNGSTYDTEFLTANQLLASWIEGSPAQPRYGLFTIDSGTPVTPQSLATADGRSMVKVGVMRDTFGRGVIAWGDTGYSRLYYALLDSNGTLVTPPMVQLSGTGIYLGSGMMATAYLPDPMFQTHIPFVKK